jgi:hypothetical protein
MAKEFVQECQREFNRLAVNVGLALAAREQELGKVERQIREIIEAIKAGLRSATLAGELERLEERKETLQKESAGQEERRVRLHPRLAEIYRRKVADLTEALNAEAQRDEAGQILRSLIEGIRLIPRGSTLDIELVGALAGILASVQKRPRDDIAGALLTLVAGTRSHLYRTLLRWR